MNFVIFQRSHRTKQQIEFDLFQIGRLNNIKWNKITEVYNFILKSIERLTFVLELKFITRNVMKYCNNDMLASFLVIQLLKPEGLRNSFNVIFPLTVKKLYVLSLGLLNVLWHVKAIRNFRLYDQ